MALFKAIFPENSSQKSLGVAPDKQALAIQMLVTTC